MNKIIALCFVAGILSLSFSDNIMAEVIFEENFDSQADWQIAQGYGGNDAKSAVEDSTVPPGFYTYRIQDSSYPNNTHNSIIIDSTIARGGVGKGITFWNESGDTNCDYGGGWCSDNEIGIRLPNGYNELWTRYYMKFDPTWKWSNEASIMIKLFRVTHYHGGNPFVFFEGGNQHPLVTGMLTVWNDGQANTSHLLNYRYENVYYPDQASPPHNDRSRVGYYPGGSYSGSGPDFDAQGQPGDSEWNC